MYVSGVAVSKFGVSPKSYPEMMLEVIQQALADAEINPTELDAIYISNNLAPHTQNQCHLASVLAGYFPDLYLPIFGLEAACAGGGVAIHQACVSLRAYERILVVGVEKMSESAPQDMLYFVAADADREFDQREGLVFPAGGALIASSYMQKYGATTDDYALVSYKNHQNGNLNPQAHFYGKNVSLEMIKESKIICSPLRLFDCSANTDGAAAVILERQKRGKRAKKIIASTLATNHVNFAQDKDPLDRKEVQKAAKKAFSQCGLLPKQIEFAEIHDGFTVIELLMMENLGLCPFGEGYKWIREGRTNLDGQFPVNPSGGLKACGHPVGATGVRQVAEVVTQLRGEAGKRQVERNNLGLAFNFGSLVGSCTVHILKND
ncbi:MAG TPA: thiolase family protein [Candidatus Wirthbacteria bacterium]|nr:thiolase family protein [Candidatus Wirthbacteria bacterium]